MSRRAELEEEVKEEAHEGACALMQKYFARKTARNQETTLGVRAWLRGYRAPANVEIGFVQRARHHVSSANCPPPTNQPPTPKPHNNPHTTPQNKPNT